MLRSLRRLAEHQLVQAGRGLGELLGHSEPASQPVQGAVHAAERQRAPTCRLRQRRLEVVPAMLQIRQAPAQG